MSSEEEYMCNYCGKTFSNSYNLTKHKKTAGYCIEIQKSRFNIVPNIETYECNHCNQLFTIKSNYHSHLDVCKVKKEYEITQLREELEILKQKYREKEEEVQYLRSIYMPSSTTLQTLFDKLIPFTEENIKERIQTISPKHLIESNNYNLSLNFSSNMGRKLSDMVLLTDKARGLVFIKNKNGEKEKHQIKGLIGKCFLIGQQECIELFNRTRNLLELYSIRDMIMPEDEARCYGDLTILREYLTAKTLDKTIKMISTVITDNCAYISKASVEQ